MELNEILENITILKNCNTITPFFILLFIVDIAIYVAIYSFIEDKFNEAPALRSVLEGIAIVLTSVVMACGSLVLARQTDIVFRFKWYVETDYSVSQLAEYFKVNEVTVTDGKTLCYIEPHSEYHKAVVDYALQLMRSEG